MNSALLTPFQSNEVWNAVKSEQVNIWDDPWLPGPYDGRIKTDHIDIYHSTVADLIDHSSRRWKRDIIENLFDEDQASRICNNPLLIARLNDEIVWRYDGSGRYSVKSGYKLLRTDQDDEYMQNSNPHMVTLSNFYARVWVVNLPSKIRITMWRIINNFVPTFANMQRRRLNVINSCPFCHSSGESIEHLMRDCCFTRQVLDKVGFHLSSNPVEVQWPYWLASFFSSLHDFQQRMLLIAYWVIWFTRNKVVHEGLIPSVIKCVSFIEASVRESDALFMSPHTLSVKAPEIWQAPGGMIMAACSTPHYHVVDAFVAEVLACLQAIVFAKELGFRRIVVEGDSLSVIKKVNCNIADKSIIALIIHDIKEVARNLESVSFCFARREANNAAHVLARDGRFNGAPMYWIEEAPVNVVLAAELDRRRMQSNF
ncbi:hypothetical protein V6N12_027456 [Hibiscus sabdariffa]|uniref:Reverse transcriptase n=1 Tax=Hibiscus sabdariffa TaxID=183260 RepID=A0ABR2DUT1_9ROSI